MNAVPDTLATATDERRQALGIDQRPLEREARGHGAHPQQRRQGARQQRRCRVQRRL